MDGLFTIIGSIVCPAGHNTSIGFTPGGDPGEFFAPVPICAICGWMPKTGTIELAVRYDARPAVAETKKEG